jgi:hypothetical protein
MLQTNQEENSLEINYNVQVTVCVEIQADMDYQAGWQRRYENKLRRARGARSKAALQAQLDSVLALIECLKTKYTQEATIGAGLHIDLEIEARIQSEYGGYNDDDLYCDDHERVYRAYCRRRNIEYLMRLRVNFDLQIEVIIGASLDSSAAYVEGLKARLDRATNRKDLRRVKKSIQNELRNGDCIRDKQAIQANVCQSLTTDLEVVASDNDGVRGRLRGWGYDIPDDSALDVQTDIQLTTEVTLETIDEPIDRPDGYYGRDGTHVETDVVVQQDAVANTDEDTTADVNSNLGVAVDTEANAPDGRRW